MPASTSKLLPQISNSASVFGVKTAQLQSIRTASTGEDTLVMAIPHGPKYFAWFTTLTSVSNCTLTDVCVLIPEKTMSSSQGKHLLFPSPDNGCVLFLSTPPLTQQPLKRKVSNISDTNPNKHMKGDEGAVISRTTCQDEGERNDVHRGEGTLLFGTLCDTQRPPLPLFVAENVHFCNLSTDGNSYSTSSKLDLLFKILQLLDSNSYQSIKFYVSPIFRFPNEISSISLFESNFSYYYHYRHRRTRWGKVPAWNLAGDKDDILPPITKLFCVSATVECDIYHLYLFSDEIRQCGPLYFHSVALIPDFVSSVFMNSIFRNIRENRDLDLAEESDDEAFFDTSEHKFVDIRKKHVMPFCYIPKFNKWAPLVNNKYSLRYHKDINV
jgi:hypothetical protein